MSDTDKVKGVRLVFDQAQEVPAPPDPAPPDPPRGDRGGGGDAPRLPEGCPIEPLGVLDDTCYYLDDLRQLRKVEGREHSRLGLAQLFGRKTHLLVEYWPRKKWDNETETWITTGWKPEEAAMALTTAAAHCGVWDPYERVRGAGAWRGEDGELVLHCGDEIMIGGRWHQPGRHDRQVYPAAPPRLRPSPVCVAGGEKGPAAALLSMLQTWQWRRGELDAMLCLGWIGAALVGGALKWRPVCWITGGAFTGKSTLLELLKGMFDNGMLSVSEPSAAGVWQTLGHSSSPVAVDELEADEDNRRANAVIKLARLAASGARMPRGGANHQATDFILRACFLFSSILVPPLLGQDRSRMAILELGQLHNEAPPKIEPRAMRQMGGELLRRMADQWHRLPQALEAYRSALIDVGHNARGADVFGTLLACADLLMSDQETPFDFARDWADRLAVSDLAEADDQARDEERCALHMQSALIPFDGAGVRRTVATWFELAAGNPYEASAEEARAILGNHGLRFLIDERGQRWVAVANTHQTLGRIFAGTHWAGRSGTLGVWVQALRRLPGAERSKKNIRIGGVACKSTLLPAALVFDVAKATQGKAASPSLDLD